MGHKVVRPFQAYEGETVRITWTLKEGGTFETEATLPPKDVRKARSTADDVTDEQVTKACTKDPNTCSVPFCNWPRCQ